NLESDLEQESDFDSNLESDLKLDLEQELDFESNLESDLEQELDFESNLELDFQLELELHFEGSYFQPQIFWFVDTYYLSIFHKMYGFHFRDVYYINQTIFLHIQDVFLLNL